ncbi:MAG: hypothetical protein RL720_2 [Actinomycetota bacterium]|jgi:hypothetical protein
MRKPERTMQQLDPLAAGTSWDVAVFFSIITWAYAVIISIVSLRSIENIPLLSAALILLSLAVIVHLWSAAPQHAPYTQRNYSIVVFLTISAGALQIASNGAGYVTFLTEWGPIAVALIFASASGYRSLPDQYFAGFAAVLTLFAVLGLESLSHPLPFGPLYFCVSGVALVGIVVLGQASYTHKASRILMAWQKTINETAVDPGLADDTDVVRPLTREARELLVSLLSSGRVTEADTARARELAGSIRAELVTLADQTWVERAGCTLHDPENVLAQLDLSAQSAISALVTGFQETGITDLQVSLRVDPLSNRLSCVVQGSETPHSLTGAKMRTYISSFLRVMYVVFEDVRFIDNDGQVNVMFYYAK